MSESYVTFDLDQLLVGAPLPCALYVYVDFRFIVFRGEGDTVDRNAFDRLASRKVKQLFIQERDRVRFASWASNKPVSAEPITEDDRAIANFREDTSRRLYDIFQESHSNKVVTQTLEASKKLVAEIMKSPYAVRPLTQLQSYSQGTVDHSVNVSILSVYLAMQMGYSHARILQHVGAGALLHDFGKTAVSLEDHDSPEKAAEKMRDHPELGAQVLERDPKVPNEVKLIVAQHHECHDGSGYPRKLKGSGIYDLARIVSIANHFDELVSSATGSLPDRQRSAISKLDHELSEIFDPQKLDKALKILKLGL